MSQPEQSDKAGDKKQKPRRHLSGGEDLLRGFLMVHESCAEIGNMATPRRFMTFLHCYQQLYRLKKEGIENKQKHLQVRVMFYSINVLAAFFLEGHLTCKKSCCCNTVVLLLCFNGLFPDSFWVRWFHLGFLLSLVLKEKTFGIIMWVFTGQMPYLSPVMYGLFNRHNQKCQSKGNLE